MYISHFKKFIRIFFALAAAGLLTAAELTAFIDPFFRYHDPLPDFPYVIDNQLSQNIGLAERFSYDTVITGSSMTMNFDTRDLAAEFAGAPGFASPPRAIKLTMNGALPHDISRILDATDRSKNTLRMAVIAIDPATWTAERGAVKYPYPEYLYDRIPWNDIRYLWNRQVLLDYCLRPLAEREATDLATLWSTDWEEEMYYTWDWVHSHYEEPALADQETAADAYLTDTRRNLEEELLPFMDAHPETQFYFFYPPYSMLYWHDAQREGHLAATLAQEREIARWLLARDNARIFFYQDLEEIVTDLDGGYMDEIHFRPTVNQYMLQTMARGECEIRDELELTTHLDALRRLVESFDFAALLGDNG